MTLKILTPKNKVRKSMEVTSFAEAKKQIELFAIDSDKSYVQVASSMKLPEVRPMRYRAKVNEDTIVRADNGRIKSRRELENERMKQGV
jgi:hypothetical protein